MRVLFIIRSAGLGGAESQLVKLAAGLRARSHEVHVATLYKGGAIWDELVRNRVDCSSFAKRSRWDLITPLRRLMGLARSFQPDVVYSFMPAANILSALAKPALGYARLVWGVRASNLDLHFYGRFVRFLPRAEAFLSRYADLVIANSAAGSRHCVDLGFDPAHLCVIPNGFDTGALAPDEDGRRRVREELGTPEVAFVLGIVGRLDRVKGHASFLRVAERVRQVRPRVEFWCVGAGDATYARELRELARVLGIDDRVRWLGARRDMRAVYSAMDVTCLTSLSEGFPNVVAESMACGTPCAAFDVGDASLIIGENDLVARQGDAEALAKAVLVASDGGIALRSRVRCRIESEFSLEKCLDRTEARIAQLASA